MPNIIPSLPVTNGDLATSVAPVAATHTSSSSTEKSQRQISLLNKQMQQLAQTAKSLSGLNIQPEEMNKQLQSILGQLYKLSGEISRLHQQMTGETSAGQHIVDGDNKIDAFA